MGLGSRRDIRGCGRLRSKGFRELEYWDRPCAEFLDPGLMVVCHTP